MADKKAVNTAAQAQSDKTKKTSFFGKVKNFFKGIVWPSKADVKTNTITVLVVVLVAAVVLILLDLIFGGAIHLMIGA